MKIDRNGIAKITGIILCGGQSCRFGKDKGLCHLGDKPMIRYAIDSLLPVCGEILISSNDPEYSSLGFKTVPDEIKGTGPISGILAGLKISKTTDNFIISCDMPFINTDLIIHIFQNKDNSLAASAYCKEFTEPLCSYFNKNAIPFIEKNIFDKKYKMIDLLNNINYKKILIDNSLPFYDDNLFLNVNTPEHYEKAEKILKLK